MLYINGKEGEIDFILERRRMPHFSEKNDFYRNFQI